MEKCLIIPDIHLEIAWPEAAIKAEAPDKVIFTGDYFDSRVCENKKLFENTAAWLKNSLNKPSHTSPKRIHLMGNHDGYRFPDNAHLTNYKGCTSEKAKLINSILTKEDWDKLKLFHVEQGWLFTHAGLHKAHTGSLPSITLEAVEQWLDGQVKQALIQAEMFNTHWIFEAGRARHGEADYGGITWCDATREFQPIEGIKQCFGHSAQNSPLWIDQNNLDLDCKQQYYGVLINGQIQTKKYLDI
jgi:hypothetical protein